MKKDNQDRERINQPSSRSAREHNLSDNLLWGINVVKEAIVRNPEGLSEVLVQKGKSGPRIQEIIDLARMKQIKLRFVPTEKLGVHTGCKHQGVVAQHSVVSFLSLDDLLDIVSKRTLKSPVKLLALDSIQDPHNMGAIFRSALAAGFEAVIIPRERSASLNGVVAKVSAGALVQLPVCRVINIAESLQILKKNDLWIFGAVTDNKATSLYDTDFSVDLCLVVGGEGKGLRPLVRKQCDYLVKIPMQSEFDSLNVSVAAAILMFEIVRQQTLIV